MIEGQVLQQENFRISSSHARARSRLHLSSVHAMSSDFGHDNSELKPTSLNVSLPNSSFLQEKIYLSGDLPSAVPVLELTDPL